MSSTSLDIVAIGDAIVDVIATCDDSFLDAHRLPKGGMQLLTASEADELYAAMGPAREISGGSAANSMAGAAALGLDAAFVGQVADDQLGAIFAHDMLALGVRFETPPLEPPPPTACVIAVPPDAWPLSPRTWMRRLRSCAACFGMWTSRTPCRTSARTSSGFGENGSWMLRWKRPWLRSMTW